jgi:hypothetical protein
MLFNFQRVRHVLPVHPIVGVTAATLLVFGLSLGFEPQPIQACWTDAPFRPVDARQADAVFTGRLLKYERVSFNGQGHYGLLTIRVEIVLKGQIAGDVQLYWVNSTFALPAEWTRGENLLAAVIRANHPGLPTGRPDLLQILQAPCSSPFIFPSSPDNIETMQAVLAGKSGDDAQFTWR